MLAFPKTVRAFIPLMVGLAAPAQAGPGGDAPPAPPAKARLAVLDFNVGEDIKPAQGVGLAALVRDEFQKSDRYDLMDRDMMKERMTEKDFAATTECDQVRCLVRYGKTLDVPKIVGGFATSFGKSWLLTIRLVDVNTGREEDTFSQTCAGDMECLLALSRQGARVLLGLAEDIPPEPAPQPSRPDDQKQLVLDLGGGVTMELLLIPPGEFQMGSPDSESQREADEGPQHRVRITKPFYIAQCEVTQAQWQAVMGSNPSRFKGDGNLPVETVSWDDCQEFRRKLSQHVGREVRLPTEAEWEYACRAGTTTPFHFGDTISTDQANYAGNYVYGTGREGQYREKTVPVGSFPANAWGLHDMHGNVWEWCQDRYGEYPSGAQVDPAGPASGGHRVFRGGSWNNLLRNCRSAIRYSFTPDHRYDRVGFRVAAGT